MATSLKTGDLPEALTRWVAEAYPQAGILSSRRRADATYEVEVEQAEGSLLMYFSAAGQWLQSRKGVAMRRLPTAITRYLEGKQREYADIYAEEVFLPENAAFFEVFLQPKHDKSLVRIHFTAEGRLVDVAIVPRSG